jgi:type IV secretion system protein VirD4
MRWKPTLQAIVAVASVAAVAFLWLATTSFIFCLITKLQFYPTRWIDDLSWWGENWWATLCVAIAPVAPTMLAALLIYALLRRIFYRGRRHLIQQSGGRLREAERGVTANHGDARWQTVEEMKKTFPGDVIRGGIVVGEAGRVDEDRRALGSFDPHDDTTWGMGGTYPLLIDPCILGPTHSMKVSGSGWYKTQEAATQIMHWFGPKVILDPSCELGPMLRQALEDRGERVFEIKTDELHCGMNVLEWLDPHDPEFGMHVNAVISAIYDEEAVQKNSDPLFTPMGRDLARCLLTSLICDSPEGHIPTLSELREAITTSEDVMPKLLKHIHSSTKSKAARQLASTLMSMKAEKTFTGVYVNAVTGTAWLTSESYANVVSEGLCKPSDILSKTAPTTIFVQIPLSALEKTPGIARVIISSLVNRIIMENGNVPSRILFLLDEARRLGPMGEIKVVRDAGRKYGITLHMIYQAISQIEEQWGKGSLDAWQASTSWIGYAAISSKMTSEEISQLSGKHGVMAYSEGDNTGTQKPWGLKLGSRSKGKNVNVHEISSVLISPENVRMLRADESIVFPAGGRPIRCGRAIWFRRTELQHLVKPTTFLKRAAE